eukprot:10985379-Alexandrium_andersonii.AAC.1
MGARAFSGASAPRGLGRPRLPVARALPSGEPCGSGLMGSAPRPASYVLRVRAPAYGLAVDC